MTAKIEFTSKQVKSILKRFRAGAKLADIAITYKCSSCAVRKAIIETIGGDNYRQQSANNRRARILNREITYRQPVQELLEEKESELIEQRLKGTSMRELSRMFGVSDCSISKFLQSRLTERQKQEISNTCRTEAICSCGRADPDKVITDFQKQLEEITPMVKAVYCSGCGETYFTKVKACPHCPGGGTLENIKMPVVKEFRETESEDEYLKMAV